ncbi:MAG: hypothetical protein V3U18_08690, partial [Alphaproteobacteria bacterium]
EAMNTRVAARLGVLRRSLSGRHRLLVRSHVTNKIRAWAQATPAHGAGSSMAVGEADQAASSVSISGL